MTSKKNNSKSSHSKSKLDFEIAFFEGLVGRDPKYVEALQILGDAYTKRGNYDKGLLIDQRLARLCPREPVVLYNLACSLALTGAVDKAFRTLERAVQFGYDDVEWMRKDADLKSLRSDPRFAKLQLHMSEHRKRRTKSS